MGVTTGSVKPDYLCSGDTGTLTHVSKQFRKHCNEFGFIQKLWL